MVLAHTLKVFQQVVYTVWSLKEAITQEARILSLLHGQVANTT
jgi:hypothetical protein